MLAKIVGTVDFNAAFVLVALVAGTVAVAIALIYRPSQASEALNFEIRKFEAARADETEGRRLEYQKTIEMTKIASNKEVELRRVDTGLIEAKRVG